MNLIREATFKDGLLVAKNIRLEDKAELEGFGEGLLSIPLGILSSEHPVVFYSPAGELAGVAGVVRLDNQVGQIWMLCTPVIMEHPITFVRQAKKWLMSIQGEYQLLWNLADARNQVHHKLLKHLGFKALRTVPVGPNNLPYLEIVKLCVSPPLQSQQPL
tara:strand:+ start:23388 stop:23867 length:480 start_codon:yes stop_codon:yes gene_type:complete